MDRPPLSLLDHFDALEDPRIDRTKKHHLSDILVIALCATLAGAESFADIALFGRSKLAWFSRFLALPNGIPSHDTFNRVFSLLNPSAFQRCFVSWMNAVCARGTFKHVQIDGKSLRGSRGGKGGAKALHLVSVWAQENGLTLGQQEVDEKSNEITAIPDLLRTLELEGCLVSIDAIGCQKTIAAQIRQTGADYVLALKANQKNLFEDVEGSFIWSDLNGLSSLRHDVHRTEEKGHGRHEVRDYRVIYDPQSLRTRDDWPDLASIIRVIRRRRKGDKESDEVVYYISSSTKPAAELAAAIREHWGIENGLHWVLDVVFKEDQSRIRDRTAAENMAWVRRVAVSLLKQDTSKGSLKGKHKRAGWDDEFLAHLLSLLHDED